MPSLHRLITSPRTLSVLGFAALTLTIFLGAWLFGISMGWALVTCTALAAGGACVLLVQGLRARRAGHAISEELTTDSDSPSRVGDADPERVDDLKRRMQEAIRKIKTSRLGQLSGPGALYELPWYITIGNPAAGKSTAIVNSGLHFPFDEGGNAVIKGIGGTRNCDWFFTSEGILLDTAGRYTANDDDRPEWLGFLSLLKKHRSRAPINGILVAVSIGELIHHEPEFALNVAKDLRQRVQELTEHLEVFAPVYVLFTKADLLPGFRHFFADLDWTERERVWGATIPYEHASQQDAVALFEKHFDELYLGLRTASVAQLSHHSADDAAPGLLTFPAEFAATRPALRSFVATLFEDNPFQFKPVFRGFYLTSAIQTTDVPALSSERVAREFGLSALPPQHDTAHSVQGYFLKKLFSEVIFADRHLVRQHISPARRLWRQAIITCGLVVLGVALAGWSWSHMNNLSLLRNVEQDLAKAVKVQEGRADLQSRLEALEIIQDRLAQLERFNDSHPLSLGLGLYQGRQMAEKLRHEYFAGISVVMLQPVKNALEGFLGEVNQRNDEPSAQARPLEATQRTTQYKSANAADIEDGYNALKTYLMLSSHEHIDVGHLSDQMTRFWRGWLETNRGAMERDRMIALAARIVSFHLGQAASPDWPTISNNLALVDGVREKLRRVVRGMPAAERVYGEIRARASTRFAPVTVASVVGPENAALLNGSRVVSGAMTAEAWTEYVQPAIRDASAKVQKNVDWVLQTSSDDDLTLEGSPEQIQKALTAMYKRDFTEEWKQFILGISIAPFATFPDAVTGMGRFGDMQTSPIGKLLRKIAEQTAWDNPRLLNLARQQSQSGIIEWVKQSVLQMAPGQVQAAESVASKTAEQALGPIGREFAGITRLTASRADGDALLDAYLKQLSKIRSRLNQLKNEGDPGPGALKMMRETLDGNNSELAETLKFVDEQMLTGLTDSQRATLRPILLRPLLETYSAILRPAAEDLNKTWAAQVHEPFTRRLAIKYPFSPQAGIEASPTEIAQVFGPEGSISKYVESTMGTLVIRRGNTITARTWGDLGLPLQPEFSAGFAQWVSPLEGGAAGDGTQGGASQAQAVFMMRPQPSPGTTAYVLEIDGQKLNYRNSAPQWANFVWPNSAGTPGARITANTYDGKSVEVVNYPGRFGLEKMINAAQRVKQADGSFRLSWKIDGIEVSIDLKVVSNAQAQGSSPGPQGQRGLGGLSLPERVVMLGTPPTAEAH